jgi:nicotinamidase-related amidase
MGATVAELAEALPVGATTVAKTRFSMLVPEVAAALEALPAVRSVLVVGIEAHVCVLQTALDLMAKGYDVHVLVDGVSSQRLADRAVALHRLSAAGAFMATSGAPRRGGAAWDAGRRGCRRL